MEEGDLVRWIADLEEEEALGHVRTQLAEGADAATLLDAARQGLDEVGRRFEASEYFLSQLMYAADIFGSVMDVLTPELEKNTRPDDAGKVLIATVEHDVHDIGKNLVAAILRAAGFEVVDLGVNVPAGVIREAVREHEPDVVALSCLLVTCLDSMEQTIRGFDAEQRSNFKILVGGNPLSPKLAAAMGADAYGADASQAVVRCRELMGGSARWAT